MTFTANPKHDTGHKHHVEVVNTGRNAAKRKRRAVSKSYDGPAKTPKGLRGKTCLDSA